MSPESANAGAYCGRRVGATGRDAARNHGHSRRVSEVRERARVVLSDVVEPASQGPNRMPHKLGKGGALR